MAIFLAIWAALALVPFMMGLALLGIDLSGDAPSRKNVAIDTLIVFGGLLAPVTILAILFYFGRRGYYVLRYDRLPPKTKWGF
jgi:uncharacterized membrane protein